MARATTSSPSCVPLKNRSRSSSGRSSSHLLPGQSNDHRLPRPNFRGNFWHRAWPWVYDFLSFHVKIVNSTGVFRPSGIRCLPGWPVDRKTPTGGPDFEQTTSHATFHRSSGFIVARFYDDSWKRYRPPSSTSLETIPSSVGSKVESWTWNFCGLGGRIAADCCRNYFLLMKAIYHVSQYF